MKFHIIVAVDPKNYDPGLLSRINDIYSTCGKIHITTMGPNTKEILPFIPASDVDTITDITAPTFNYAHAVNRSVRGIISKKLMKDESEALIMTDIWNVISLMQLEPQIRDTDLLSSYISVEMYRDSVEQTLNKNSQRIMLSILGRLRMTKETKVPPPKKVIPVPITSFKCFIQCGGLEERLFTDVSRLYFIEYLESKKLNRIGGVSDGIRLSFEHTYPEKYIKKDLEVYENLKSFTKNGVFLPSNNDCKWGDPSRIKFLKIENGTPNWNTLQDKCQTLEIHKTNENVENQKIEEPKRVIPIKAKIPISGFDVKYQNTILAVRNNIKDVSLASNILKTLYLKYGPVTILTDRKKFPAIDILNSFMIREIIDLPQHQSHPIDFKKYTKIYKIPGFTNSISIDKMEDAPEIKEHNPFCSTPSPFKKIPDNSICFAMSANTDIYRKINNEEWVMLNKIYEKIISYDIPIILVGAEGERSFIETVRIKNIGSSNRQVSLAINQSITEISSIVNFCKTVVTNPLNNMFWLSYAQKKNMVVVVDPESEQNEIPDVHWIRKIDYTIDRVAERIITMIVENV